MSVIQGPFEPLTHHPWGDRLLQQLVRCAESAATVDYRTQVGAVLVSYTDSVIRFNYPVGVNSPLWGDSHQHAEVSAIVQGLAWQNLAHRHLDDETFCLVATWAACPSCAAAIVDAGIRNMVVSAACMNATPERWIPAVNWGIDYLVRNGVTLWAAGGGRCERTLLMDGREVLL